MRGLFLGTVSPRNNQALGLPLTNFDPCHLQNLFNHHDLEIPNLLLLFEGYLTRAAQSCAASEPHLGR